MTAGLMYYFTAACKPVIMQNIQQEWIPLRREELEMASIVLGLGTSHSPQLSLPSEHWLLRGEEDQRNTSLYRVPDGKHVTFEELLAEADPRIAQELTP